MKGMGFTNVSVIRGGWNGWKAAGGKVEVTPEPQLR